jgi:hypothetical protein
MFAVVAQWVAPGLRCTLSGAWNLVQLAGSGGASTVDDQFEVQLEDDDLLSEVELTTNLSIAATASAGRLAQAEIDRILGVRPATR